MQIGKLSRITGVSRDTLRYYEKRGLIRATRRANGYRDYGEDALVALDIIATAKALGFTLAEIEAEVPDLAAGGLSRDRVAGILHDKIAVIDGRIAELTRLRESLTQRLSTACPLGRGGDDRAA